jgi:hypothetical protein
VSGVRHATAITVVLAALAMTGAASERIPPALSGAVPVLVELFTAEGCSSCPPADALLAAMVASQPAAGVEIVGLGEHVDYWDRLGWKDRFSSSALTARQQGYADRLGLDSIYTPQLVVDGADALVGTDVDAARQALERAKARPHGAITLTVDSSASSAVALTIGVSQLPPIASGDRADVVVAIVEDGLQSDVKRGENRGRMLSHAAVVRQLSAIAPIDGPAATARTEIKLKADWRREKLGVVAFVQERKSRRVLAAARMLVAPGTASP